MDAPGPSAPSQPFEQGMYGGANGATAQQAGAPTMSSGFDIFEWYPKYQSCQKFFLDHAQHDRTVRAVAAFMNILLPCQRQANPINNFRATESPLAGSSFPASASLNFRAQYNEVSLIPYVRRLVISGLDQPPVLHGFFGDDWIGGIGPLHEQERRNYMFAAKSSSWLEVKREYDISPWETVPFMAPISNVIMPEIQGAETSWSKFLAMQDWMVGPRAPPTHMTEAPPAGFNHRPSYAGASSSNSNATPHANSQQGEDQI